MATASRPPPAGHRGQPSLAGCGPLASDSLVEVRVDGDGFYGTWYQAKIVGISPAQDLGCSASYEVTYDDIHGKYPVPLKATVAPTHIRPRPPALPSSAPALCLYEIVEAFHNNGWWSGIVFPPKDPTSASITVAFPVARVAISFKTDQVRPRREYVGGEWIRSEAVIQPKCRVKVYSAGDKIEVEKYRDVYGSSWFPATVTKVVDLLSYVVEYFVGELKVLEYLHYSFIRPAVELMARSRRFSVGTRVEMCYEGAWSLGFLSGIVRKSGYEIEYEVRVDGGEVVLIKEDQLNPHPMSWNGNTMEIMSGKKHSISRKNPEDPRLQDFKSEHAALIVHMHQPSDQPRQKRPRTLNTQSESDDNMHMCQPMQERPNEETTSQKRNSRSKKYRPKVIQEEMKDKVQQTLDLSSAEKCSVHNSDRRTRTVPRASVRRSLQFEDKELGLFDSMWSTNLVDESDAFQRYANSFIEHTRLVQ
ncbi:hypothetical protein EJB05_54985, partial [Eragrostis curvula]